MHYHDTEWGVPVWDEKKMCEMFFLETFQAGLSWITILKKRENFRKALDDFDPEIISKYDEVKFEALRNDPGIIRCRHKIKAAINGKAFFKISPAIQILKKVQAKH